MNKRIWHTHTGSAPGCQNTPRTIISAWFDKERPLVRDARSCFNNLLELEQSEHDGEYDEEHRCFNRRDYALGLSEVTAIIRELKAEYNEEATGCLTQLGTEYIGPSQGEVRLERTDAAQAEHNRVQREEAERIARLNDAAPGLLEACKFSLSVHKAQGLFDMSERMAARRLEAAIAKAEGEGSGLHSVRGSRQPRTASPVPRPGGKLDALAGGDGRYHPGGPMVPEDVVRKYPALANKCGLEVVEDLD